MQLAAYQAARRFIGGGTGNTALNRVLDIARRLSQCEMVAIVAVEDSDVKIISSLNFPYSIANSVSVADQDVKVFFSEPRLVLDFSDPRFKRGHPILSQTLDVKFLASHPLPLKLLPYQLVIICMDTENAKKRPPHLLRWMGTIAAIFADELSLIGEVALLAEREAKNSERHNFALQSIKDSSIPCMMIDTKFNVHGVSAPLLKILGVGIEPLINSDARKSLPEGFAFLQPYIERVATEFLDNSSVNFSSLDGKRQFTLSCVKFSFKGDKAFFTLLELRTVDVQELKPPNLPSKRVEESVSITSEFLLRTVIKQRRLLHRGNTAYHVVNRWRKNVKDSQLAALRAIKRDPPPSFVQLVAEELAASAELLFGRTTFGAVTNVPCGHSGKNCLAALVAREVAKLKNLPYLQAFDNLDVRGTSHPTRNSVRPKMRIVDPPQYPVLLIDDVATSGSHIAEAAKKLRVTSPAVFSLVWISD
jgi:hypothetical protein